MKKFIEKIKGGSSLKYLLHAAILVGVGVAAVRYLDRDELLIALQRFDYLFLPLILALSTGYIFLKGWRFVLLMRPVTDVPWGTMVRGYVAGTPATLLPGGVAARAGLMSQAGVPVEKSAGPVAYSSLLDQAVFLLGLFVAAFWVDVARTPALIFFALLIVSAHLLLIPQIRRWLGRAVKWVAKKFNFLERWQHFLSALKLVSVPRILLLGLAYTFIGLVLQVVMLDLSLCAFGMTLPYPTLFLACILPAMLGRLSAIPAGLGVTEASMVGFLTASSALDVELVTAATVVFRVSTTEIPKDPKM